METCAFVGIFWGIRSANGVISLLADRTPISDGEPYGEYITHPVGHCEFWDNLSRLGATVLRHRGVPELVAWSEYEDFPRGRVVYRSIAKQFVIYADKRLQTKEFIRQLVTNFNIPNGSYIVRSDPHYSKAGRCI